MNKAFIAIIIAVCILGMALIMLTQWQAQNADPGPVPAKESTAAPSGAALSLPGADSSTERQNENSASTGMERGFAFDDSAAQQKTGSDLPVTDKDPAVSTLPGEVLAESHTPALGSGSPATSAPTEKPVPAPAAPAPEKTVTPVAEKPAPAAPAAPAVSTPPAVSEAGQSPAPEAAVSKPQEKKQARPATPSRTVTRFVVYARESGATIRLVGSSPIRFKEPFALKAPDRVVVDLVGDWKIKAPGVPKNPLVTNIRLGKMDNRTRVVIDMSGPAKVRYTLSKDHKQLDVRVDH